MSETELGIGTAKEQRAEERRLLSLDGETRMPRIVRITANEARTLDRDKDPHGRNNAYTCMQCGHLTLFHQQNPAAMFCGVKDCKCETWDMDYDEVVQRKRDAEEARWGEVVRARRRSWIAMLIAIVAVTVAVKAVIW